ncbi:helix-turn-helix domain-containing protein [Paraburkholderia sp. CNPSo 3076]|uniref:helix-turn-helix domain-containing protein n=1 Tax=Paraburkholderia sp. CNPSo 3076 TaxID=2940936 RepID=UPI003A52206A
MAAGPNQSAEGFTPRDFLPLTFREMRVAILASRGMANKSIAREMDIEESTVRTYLRNIGDKLHVVPGAQTLIDAILGAQQNRRKVASVSRRLYSFRG